MSARDSQALHLIRHGLEAVLAGLSQLEVAEDWIDQYNSPLGKKQHLAAARRGEFPSSREGRKVLVKRADLDAYLARHRTVPAPSANDQRSEAQRLATILNEEPRRRARRAAGA